MSQRSNGFVFIVESPSGSDLLDGRTEGRTLNEAFRLSGTNSWYSLVTSKDTLTTALSERLRDAAQHFHPNPPILHFSMHGNTEGVELTNNEFLTWRELRIALEPINEALTQGALICMSSCFGSSGCRMAMHEDAAKPFWALVGNTEAANWDDSAVAYVTFYHQLFKGRAVTDAVDAMRVASGDGNFVAFEGRAVKSSWAEYMEKERAKTTQGIGGLLNALANAE